MRQILTIALVFTAASVLQAADSAVPTYPGPNRPDEPLRKEFSLAAAADFLDAASADWWQTRGCFTCHTNYSYLLARPGLKTESPVATQMRQHLEELVEQRWAEKGPRWDAEVIMSGAVLAQHDAATTGKLHETARKALDRMWTVQREDGGFNWLKCNWPPMESDDHFGATVALIGVGAAPDDYRSTPAAVKGLEQLKKYLAANPPPTLHHRLMVLWADSYKLDLTTDGERAAWLDELTKLQRDDGGWNIASFGDWKRGDDTAQDTTASDGYATGLAIFILRRMGTPANDPRIVRGIAWLKANQRESGRWYTRSLFKDNKHYLSHAGTAMAVLALTSCGISD
ncbi:MAG TPA: squalene--hopene cyclase [Pirellulaceae bacterium]|nr:squalene--hopene cyclase [Pirellulaceae bacterium]